MAIDFVTGASGFLGRRLVLELCNADPAAEIWVLVRSRAQAAFQEWLRRARVPRERVRIVDGDVEDPDCGIDPDLLQLLGTVGGARVFHCAAHYDLTADEPDLNRRVNVEGTAHVLHLAERIGATSFNHISTVAVAGNHHGEWSEAHLDEATSWRNNYGRTKHAAERLVRESLVPRRRIFRLGVLVGDTETGTDLKPDGIYRFFPVVRTLVRTLPRRLPLPGAGWGAVPICPVDHAARSTVALAGLAEEPGFRVWHVFEDDVLRADEILRLLYETAGHGRSVNFAWTGHLAQWIGERARHDGVIAKLGRDIRTALRETDVPTELLGELNQPTSFTNRTTGTALLALGIRSPRLEHYLPRIWHGWLAHDAIDRRERGETFFHGKRVLLTGATSGIGRHVLAKLVLRGASAVVLGRSPDKLQEALRGVPHEAAAKVTFVLCDLECVESVDKAVQEVLADGTAVDIVVHSAGISIDRPFTRMSDDLDEVARMTKVNFLAPLRLIRGLLPVMARTTDSRVVVLSSISTQVDIPGFGPYAATKAALDQVLRTLPAEEACQGVTFTSVRLPLVRSPMTSINPRLRDVPMLSESAAAERVLDAAITGRTVVDTGVGRFFDGLRVVFPGAAPVIASIGWRSFVRLPYVSRMVSSGIEGGKW